MAILTSIIPLSDAATYNSTEIPTTCTNLDMDQAKLNSTNSNETLNNNKPQKYLCEMVNSPANLINEDTQEAQLQRPRRSSRNNDDSARRRSSRNTRQPIQNTQQNSRSTNVAVGPLLDLPSGYGN